MAYDLTGVVERRPPFDIGGQTPLLKLARLADSDPGLEHRSPRGKVKKDTPAAHHAGKEE